jgi:hypothetical protein
MIVNLSYDYVLIYHALHIYYPIQQDNLPLRLEMTDRNPRPKG